MDQFYEWMLFIYYLFIRLMLQIWACQFRDQQNQFAKEIKTYELI